MSSGAPRIKRQSLTVPLLKRESMGDLYHVLTFDLAGTDAAGMQARAGQFLMVRGAEWSDAPLLPRPMSYLTAGPTPSILIKVFGEGTRRLARAEAGEPFTLLGPLGVPWRATEPGRRAVLVGGGVGIAPLWFLAKEMVARGQRPITLYGGRSRSDLPLRERYDALGELHITTEDGSVGHEGRVTDLLPRLLEGSVEVFTCGPDRMMAAVAELCAARNIPCEASLETPMACGYGVCLGCPVPAVDGSYLYACMEGPCLDARRIDWSRADHAPVRSETRGPGAA